ncbi:MAG: hypothetical protein ACW97Z_15395 [Candidatus Hodarchaeales archaeon]|jgi:hypothetical protein
MTLHEHWAIFVEGEEVKWTFGEPKEDFQQIVVDFLKGLRTFGEELFGEGIASITFDLPQYSGSKTAEIFIVSLHNHFYFIISNPATTLMLISAKEGIPFNIKEVMTAVLVGQASILYATSIEDVNQKDQDKITKQFQNIILDINPSYMENNQVEVIVGKSGTNFGILSLEECMLFHYFLRKKAEKVDYISPTSWCLISHQDGGDIPFSYNIEDDVLLGGYFSAITGLLSTLFNSKPRFLAFGSSSIRKLRFIYGNQFFMAIDKTFMLDLLLTRKFQKEFFETSYTVIKDIAIGIKDLIIEEILQLSESQLRIHSAEALLDLYIGETTETMTFSFGDDDDEDSELLREEQINQLLRVWGRLLSDL